VRGEASAPPRRPTDGNLRLCEGAGLVGVNGFVRNNLKHARLDYLDLEWCILMGAERFSRKGVALRKSPRERKDNVVRIELGDGAPPLSGVLSDLSATGARLSLSAPYNMPAKFALVLPPSTRRLCRLVWQSQENLGVEFLAARTRAPAKPVARIPDPPPEQPQQPRPGTRTPATGKPGSAGPGGSLPLWNYSDNQRTKRR
jgi:hypothetical protein